MGLDRDGSKNGGYVGGFFHLFDWKAKSRKKLFSSKSEIPEHTKQGKRGDGNLPTTRVYMMDEDESGMWPNARGNSDYSCASSVTDEEGFGSSKGPNVVARLMGLDSMPVSFSEPYSNSFFDTQSLRDTQFHNQRRDVDFSQNYQAMYSGDLIHRTAEPDRNAVELKPQRILNRPIEKFQSEILPSKSAKTIPVSQHKLLSPIKCPGFVHSRNAADIMEAAAKIIESAPPQSMKSKLPSTSLGHIKVGDNRSKEEISAKGPSLRLRDLKEKVDTNPKISKLQESSKRVSDSESTAAKYLRGQSLSKSYNGGGSSSSSFRASIDNNSGKSVSLAVQAKVNIQKREGLSSSDRNGSFQQEQSESKLKRHHKKKSPALNNSGVLRQNSQKQNCSMDKEKLPSKSAVRKPLLDSSIRAKSSTSSKSNGNSGSGTKSGSRKLEVLDGDKEISQSNLRNFPRKKRSISEGFQNKVADDFLHKKQSVQKNWIENSKKNGMDVVSFTFTAPLSQKNNSFDHQWGKGVMSETDSMKLSSLGYNVIGGDALSKLLEQKLKELSYEVSSSSCNASASVGSNSTTPSTFQEPDTVNSKPRLHAKGGEDLLLENSKLGADRHADLFSRNPPLHHTMRQQCQGTDDMEVDVKNQLDIHNPSPVSVLEPSFVSESWISSESMESNWIEGKSTNQVAEVLGARKPRSTETDIDLSDSASSLSTGGTIKSSTPKFSSDFFKSTNWETEYVKEMLFTVESMYRDFTLGRTGTMIPPHMFQHFEDRNDGFMQTDDVPKRKLLFDCVSESIENRFRRFVGGGSQPWRIGLETARRKERLAEEVYKEIKGWRGMMDSMVDDLVDKDMGSNYGKWLEFEAEGFEVGVAIEDEIMSSLVDEAIAGILRL